MNRPTPRWPDWLGAVLAVLPLVAAAWLFHAFEKFPTNDDWVFARSARVLAEEGRWQWVAHNGQLFPSTATLIVAGAAASAGGFTYDRLTATTLLLSLTGAAGVYWLSRVVGASVSTAVVFAWALSANPWFFGHCFTFMTDAPSVGLSLAAAALFGAAILRGRDSSAVAGSVILTLAVLARQTALSLILLPLVGWYSVKDRSARLLLIAGLAPVVALAVFEIGVRWFSDVHRASAIPRTDVAGGMRQVLFSAYGLLLVVGFSLLPLAGLLLQSIEWRRQTKVVALFGLLPAAFFLARGGRAILTSATGPSLQNAHFGPVLLSDCFEPGRWGDIGGVEWPTWVWSGATLFSFVSLVVIAAASENTITRWWNDRRDASAAVEFGLWLSGVGAGVVLLLLMGFSFDRYWLAVVGPLVGWAAIKILPPCGGGGELASRWGVAPANQALGLADGPPHPPQKRRPPPRGGRFLINGALARQIRLFANCWSIATLAAFFALDVVFTHDWLAFNETRWNLVRRLQAEGFTPPQIDGGYEVNGWFRSEEDPLTRPRPGGEPARWWSENAERFIAVGPRPGMVEVDRAEWFSWAAGRPVPVLVLKRAEAPTSP